MPSPSKGRRPNNLTIDPSAAVDPVSILKSRDSTPKALPKRGPPGRLRANPLVTQAAKAPPSPIRTHSADDYFCEPAASVSARRPFDADVEADDDASMLNRENEFVPRDSHDLSLPNSQPTRDSLMANMLLSLDQLTLLGQATPAQTTLYDEPRGGYSSNYAPAPTIADERAWTRSMHPRSNSGYAHSHSYSYSSDLEVGDDAARINRGRRSNSSSNYYHPGPGRMNSMRESPRSSQASTPRRVHNRGAKGSKSSSTNSIDRGRIQASGSQRWVPGHPGGSSSFDYGNQCADNVRPWETDFPESFLNDDFEAAPTPTIPGGPRRTAPPTPVTATYTNPEPLPEPKTPTLERKRSARSAKSFESSRRRGEPKHSHSEIVPPMPNFKDLDLESAPPPRAAYGKAKDAPQPTLSAAPTPHAAGTPQPKEKQGFFRRVFGSRNTSATIQAAEMDNSPSQVSTCSTDNSDRPDGKPQNASSQAKAQSATPPSEPHPPNALQKKPSSFFRRRKKSTADHDTPPVPGHRDAPPVPPINFELSKDAPSVPTAAPSPVSSLRKVMNPYLRGSSAMTTSEVPEQSSVADTSAGPEEAGSYKREFSPDYEPSPTAVIRQVNNSNSSLPKTSWAAPETPTRSPPDDPASSETRNNSFLNLDPPSDVEHGVSTPSKDAKYAAMGRSRTGGTRAADQGVRDTTVGAQLSSEAKPAIGSGSADSRFAAHDVRELRDDTLRPIRRHIRAALEITDSEEDVHSPTLALPIEGTSPIGASPLSPVSGYKPNGGEALGAQAKEHKVSTPQIITTTEHMDTVPLDEPDFVVGDPTEDDRQKAQQIFDGNEDFIQKDKAAGWMGSEGLVRQRALRAYMELYDFSSLSILDSLREICARLVLRGETQQVDRILSAFSKRWTDCNPNHGFKSTDSVHTICYSIMLLNTDLHLADIEQKMTRGQFVKNTMATIQHTFEDESEEVSRRDSILPGKGSMLSTDEVRPSVDPPRQNRLSFLPPGRTDTNSSDAPADSCGPLVKSTFDGSMKAWEGQVEIVLKNIYASIRDERLPLFGAEPERYQSGLASQSNLSVKGMLKRTPSVLSKAPSESQSSIRGRVAENSRTNASRWTSKSRSRHRLGGTGFSSSRTSFDDGNSMWSPTGSSANWSRQSLGRTHTTMSVDSFGSSWPRDDFQQSIGFANALSQAIIREDEPMGKPPSIMSDEGLAGAPPLLEDESLELAGPPWVKEGIVTHKHHLDGIDRRAKDRHWSEVFAVVQKGTLSLFSFTPNKSLRNKRRNKRAGPIQVGGGNWQENATNLGSFNLRQCLASALPPPGYSRSRPHVWALSLPTGAVHLFQVGTPEIVKEFVTTANYWSARLSTHPLVGGISNIEYGWGESIVNNALVVAANDSTSSIPNAPMQMSRPGSSATNRPARRGSIQSGRSFRSGSLDYGSGPGGGGRHKLPADRVHIAEWTAPAQSMRPSTVGEEEQLHVLEAYVRSIESELQGHNQLRNPMQLAFTPRGNNAAKAMANWERKSAYLLRESVKYRTYVDCLSQADGRKKEIYREREERLEEREQEEV